MPTSKLGVTLLALCVAAAVALGVWFAGIGDCC
jgi:hypothetical protein